MEHSRAMPTRVTEQTATRRSWWLYAAAAVVLVALLVLVGRRAAAYIPAFTGWVHSLGLLAPVLFIVGYAAACVAFVPASLLTLAAGATFGIAAGILYVVAGASLGAIASFLIARYVARDRIEKRLSTDPRLQEIDRAVADSGIRIMFLMRLSPVFPFGLLNYALGLTNVTLRDFAVALVGIIPGTALYVYAGSVAGQVATAAGGAEAPRGTAYYAVLVVGLIATVVATVIITRIARRALTVQSASRPDARDG